MAYEERLCNYDNTDDIEQRCSSLEECLNCKDDSCPNHIMLRKWAQMQNKDVK